MRRTLLPSALMIAMLGALPLGCDAGDEGRTSGAGPAGGGGKADDAEGDGDIGEIQQAHLDAVGACETKAQRNREHTSDLRLDRMETLERDRRDCLTEANNQITDDLEVTLSDASSSLEGESRDAFDGWRSASAGLCEVLTDASDGGRDKGAAVTYARCIGDAELHLAELVQSFADLGGPRSDAAADRETYSSCYEAFDAASEATEPDLDAAAGELTSCIRAALLDESGIDLAIRISETFPGRDEDMVLKEVEDKFSEHGSDANELCMVLGAASPAAGSDAAESEFLRCEVTAAVWMGELILAVVPEADPGDSEPAADPEPEPEPDPGN